jgi:hypothetical protein
VWLNLVYKKLGLLGTNTWISVYEDQVP